MDLQSYRKLQVIDGGLATELVSKFNHTEIHNDPLWSSKIFLTNPSSIKKVHENFLLSGADIIETCTYQASAEGFAKHMKISTSDAFKIITDACKLGVEARDKFWESYKIEKDIKRLKPLVGGSMGPYGACIPGRMEYSGKYVDQMSIEQLINWHSRRVDAVIDSGVDICVFETIPALKEAQAICRLIKDRPQMPAWISFSCRDDKSTCFGDDLISIINDAAEIENLVAIGINCTNPKYCSTLIGRLKDALQFKNSDKLICVYPDSGEIWHPDNTWTKPCDWLPIYEYVQNWVKNGANWIGGCCRVSAEDIHQIKQQLSLSLHI